MSVQKIRTVLVTHDRPADVEVMLCRRFPEVRFNFATTEDLVAAALAASSPDAVFSVQHMSFSGPVLRTAMMHPSLKWFHVGGSGYDYLLPWPREGIRVSTGAGVLAPFLAETVLAGILVLNANLLQYAEQMRRCEWRRRTFRPLRGQTLLIVGLGAIGSCVARLAKAFGMRVVAVKRSSPLNDPSVDEILPPDAVGEAIGQADIVSLHVRLNEDTAQMVNARWFKSMKPGAILVNTSRGSIIDEAALLEALESGHLGGAYLDVFAREPLAASHPLWRFPNVLITPHAADNVSDWPQRYAARFAENLARWNSGRPLLSEIPVKRTN